MRVSEKSTAMEQASVVQNNTKVYSSPDVVDHYANYSQLQAPEKTIFDLLDPLLPGMKMLDIGVGGGRTTAFFAPRVKEYIAIDLSENMLETCRIKFGSRLPNAQFLTGDARHLAAFSAGYFDFVLFSFNGIDNVPHGERRHVLREVRRVCRAGGFFCFSSHNLLHLPHLLKPHFTLHPVKFLRNIAGTLRLIKNNREQIKKMRSADCIEIYDDVHDFGLYTSYIRPSAQLAQLENCGFTNARLFTLKEGALLKASQYEQNTEPWIYYLCN